MSVEIRAIFVQIQTQIQKSAPPINQTEKKISTDIRYENKQNKPYEKKKPNKIADGPAVVRVNIFVRSISKIDDVTMVSLSQQILLHKYLDNLLANQTKQIK